MEKTALRKKLQTLQICVNISYFTYTVDTCSMFKFIIYKCHEYHQWVSPVEGFLEKLRLEGVLETVAWLESQQCGMESQTQRERISVLTAAMPEQVNIL